MTYELDRFGLLQSLFLTIVADSTFTEGDCSPLAQVEFFPKVAVSAT